MGIRLSGSSTVGADGISSSTQIASGTIVGSDLNDSVVNDLTTATAASGDYVAIADVSASNAKKKALVSDIVTLSQAAIGAGAPNALTAVTAASGDYVVLADVSDSNNAKKALVSDIVALSSAVADSTVIVDSGNGHGSTNVKIRRFSNIRVNTGSDITYADSAANGASFTINTAGRYAVSYHDRMAASQDFFAITVNDTNPADVNAGQPLTYAQGLRALSISQSTRVCGVSWTGYLAANDVVRAHTNGGMDTTDAACMFTITRVG